MIRLSDEQWERIRNHFPEEHIPDGRPGRKPIPTRRVLEAVLWILNTGAQWHMLPQSYPNYKSVHRRFQAWSTAKFYVKFSRMLPTNFATKGCWTKKRASSTRPLRWPRAEARRSVRPSAEKA